MGALLIALLINMPAMAEASPESTLDALHKAGAAGNEAEFVALLTPDAVFIGLADGGARLQGTALRDFVSGSLAADNVWDYRSADREIRVSADGSVAWFDEALQSDLPAGGHGSGVLVRSDAGIWKIAQYHLSLSQPGGAAAAPAAVPATGAPLANEAPQKPECRKARHKTNKQASC
tara:strand:- start:77 stop:607 length:531 start_codon:yes stop_codon:yes gene_type:complete